MIERATTVLIVDDDRLMREMLADYLRVDGMVVRVAASGEEALRLLAHEPADVVVADLVMPGMGGLDVLDRLTRRQPHPEVIVVTGYGTVESAVRSLRMGAFEYLQKPVSPEVLRGTVARAVELKRLLGQDDEVRRSVDLFLSCRRIVGLSERARVFEQGLATLLTCTSARAGLFVVWEWGKSDLEVAVRLGLCEERALALAREVEAIVLREAPERPLLTTLQDGEQVLIVPLSRGDQVSAAMMACQLPEAGFDAARLREAAFLGEHLCYALQNLMKTSEPQDVAFMDDLTGLYNARYFDVVLAREISATQITGGAGRSFAILLLNIDHLRGLNDRFGHLTGSKVLVEMGRVLRRCVREVDPVFRYGGDEYTLMLRGADSRGALQVAERIRRSIEAHPFLAREGLDIRLTASIGVVCFPEHGSTRERLLELADGALFRAKKTTRNVVVLAEE
jgi:two-component system cell cycle response regulator